MAKSKRHEGGARPRTRREGGVRPRRRHEGGVRPKPKRKTPGKAHGGPRTLPPLSKDSPLGYLTPDEQRDWLDRHKQRDDRVAQLVNDYNDQAVNTAIAKEQSVAQEAKDRSAAKWDAAGRGLSHSSIRDADLADIAGTAAKYRANLDTQLRLLAIQTYGADPNSPGFDPKHPGGLIGAEDEAFNTYDTTLDPERIKNRATAMTATRAAARRNSNTPAQGRRTKHGWLTASAKSTPRRLEGGVRPQRPHSPARIHPQKPKKPRR